MKSIKEFSMNFTEMTIEQLQEWVANNKTSPFVHEAIGKLVELKLEVLDKKLDKYDTRYICSL